MEKPKTSDPSKLHYLGSDVFKNAKYSSMFKICYLGDAKCFFQKFQILQFEIEKLTKLILKINQLLQNLKSQRLSAPFNNYSNFMILLLWEVPQMYFSK